MRNVAIFTLALLLASTLSHAAPSQLPKWAESGICTEPDCAVGQASKKADKPSEAQDAQMSALAHALQNLRLSLSTNVQAEYNEQTAADGQSHADSRVKIYAGMHNIGYKILDRYEDKSRVYIKIQYDPSKKLANADPAPEFRELENLEKLCDDTKLNGYYCVGLGEKYHKGELELAPNPKLALKYYKKACSLGTLEGCVLAGELTLAEAKAESKAPESKSAESKSKESSTLDSASITPIALDPKATKAAQWYFSHACENGYGLGCFKRAALESQARKKLDLYTQGCALDDERSCTYLGEVYALGLANLRANPEKARALYTKATERNPYSQAALLLLLDSAPSANIAKDAARMDRKALRDLCEHSNATACAYLGQRENDNALLQKAAMLESAHAHYLLALRQNAPQAQIDMLATSCELGLASDFTKGCEMLGDMLAPSDKQAAQSYYQASCGHLFYEKSACQKLYEIDPKLCNNESICLALGGADGIEAGDELVADVASAAGANASSSGDIANAASAVALSNAVDALLDGTSGTGGTNDASKAPKPRAQDFGAEATELDSIQSAESSPETTTTSWSNRAFRVFEPREPKRVRIMGEIGLGAHAMSYPQIKGMARYVESDDLGFMGRGKLGLELSTAKPRFSLFAAPYVQLSYAQLFGADEFASGRDDEEDEDGQVSALLFGAGLHAGLQYKIWRLYGIAEYGANFSKISHNISVPLRDMISLGVGAGVELRFVRLGVEYLYSFYSYNTGSVYPNRGGANLVLDSASVRGGGSVFLFTIGFGF